MTYYKIIKDNTFIGIINSNSFIQYQEINHMFIGATPATGDLVECNNKLYRSLWMKPINENITISYEIVNIIEITKEEYINFMKAIQKNEIIEIEEQEEVSVPIIPKDPDISIEFLRTSKLSEMSYACRKTIENGFDLELRNEIKHFSLDTQDQLNLITLNAMADTEDAIPYHADGEECIFYTAAEIKKIVAAANNFKIYQTTYYNALKAYINSLETIEDIAAVEYGMTIPEEYQTEVLKSL